MEENVQDCPNLPESQHRRYIIPVEILLLIAESRSQHPPAGGWNEPLHLSLAHLVQCRTETTLWSCQVSLCLGQPALCESCSAPSSLLCSHCWSFETVSLTKSVLEEHGVKSQSRDNLLSKSKWQKHLSFAWCYLPSVRHRAQESVFRCSWVTDTPTARAKS